MDLNALRSTRAIVEHGGIAPAVRMTGTPRSTLSRHLAELENALGLRLVERTSRRFRLTEAGQTLIDLVTEPLKALEGIADRIGPNTGPLSGRLRLSVPVLFGHTLLGRVVAAFAEAHPDVFLDVMVDDRHVDLLREGFDAAVRIRPAPDSSLTGRLLTRSRLVLVAAPGLAKRLGHDGTAPEKLVWPAIVRAGWGDDGGWDVEMEGGRNVRIAARPRLALSSPVAMLDAVLAQLGAAFLPESLIRGHVAGHRLIVLGTRAGPAEEVWILHAAGRLPGRKLVALMDVMTGIFAA
uniref:LysR family transcriptional regulator n=1 Tax=uncultured Sphingomonas sp. TaxID=158754 RepID=UPI0035CAF214